MKSGRVKLVKTGDILLAVLLLVIGYWLFGGFNPADTTGSTALIQLDNSIEYEVDLKKDRIIELDEFTPPVQVQVQNNAIRITKNDCAQKVCIKMGAISEPGQMIVCVPKKILIFIPVGNDKHRIKATTG
jgi:hypothetical protein